VVVVVVRIRWRATTMAMAMATLACGQSRKWAVGGEWRRASWSAGMEGTARARLLRRGAEPGLVCARSPL
jgi:hypothetical protein